ncbi:MAG: VWA domain-containing protein [Candidatus Acidiferrales bacterium]
MEFKRMAQRPILIALTLFVATISCFAQQSKPNDHKTARLTVSTHLVEINVVVDDGNDRPVSGLEQKDFTVLDDGHLQGTSFFAASAHTSSQVPLAIPPDAYTNVLNAHGGVPPSITIILLDGLNTALNDQAHARDQVIKYLRTIQPQDHVALYALGEKLTVVHDFTTDASSLLSALAHYDGSTASTMRAPQASPITTPGPFAQLNTFIADINKNSVAFFSVDRIAMTLDALNAIARHVEGLPGRKSLIWVVGDVPIGFHFDNRGTALLTPMEKFSRDPIMQTEQLLADADVALYPVDARGLMTENPGWSNVLAMQDLAKQTGGRAFYNTNDIMTSIQRAVADGDNSYVLGYYPDHSDWKGEFRKLKVKVDKQGLKVRARQGYFAIPELHEKTKDLQEKLGRIAMSPLDASGISMTAQIVPIPTNAAREIKLTLGFDPRGVQFTADAGREAAALQYALLQLDQTGKILTAVENPLPVNISMAQYAVGIKQGMSFSIIIPLFSNATELSVILRDRATGTAGSLHIPLSKYQTDEKN